MLNTTLRNGLMLLVWLCLIFSVRAEEVPFLAPQQRPQLEANKPWPADRFLVLAYHDVEDDAADQPEHAATAQATPPSGVLVGGETPLTPAIEELQV